jgi:hypothetical protein
VPCYAAQEVPAKVHPAQHIDRGRKSELRYFACVLLINAQSWQCDSE